MIFFFYFRFECPAGTYSSTTGASGEDTCLSCPTSTISGATECCSTPGTYYYYGSDDFFIPAHGSCPNCTKGNYCPGDARM